MRSDWRYVPVSHQFRDGVERGDWLKEIAKGVCADRKEKRSQD